MTTVHSGLRYGSGRQLLDLHVPDDVEDPPVVVWIHGGGFREGGRESLPANYPPVAIWDSLAAAGIACATVDYRLSQEAIWPAQRDDIATALVFLRQHSARLGIDASRIGTWGESAGGHLALMAGLTEPGIRCVVGYYPVTDLLAISYEGSDSPLVQLIGGRPSTRPDLARDASPIAHVSAESPPCLLVHGDSDRLLPASQSTSMHAALLAAGVTSTLRLVPAADHCFEGYADLPGLIGEAVDYLGAHLKSRVV